MNRIISIDERLYRSRIMHVLLIVPLLLAALFAYQAGNSFELTAGASRVSNVSRATFEMSDREKAGRKQLWLLKARALAFVRALVRVYLLPPHPFYALSSAVPQRMRDLLMTPIKFTSRYVG
ncbi:hypothetical protein KP806_15445 [Paenibacillus sp. N4]|uniref:hypothetical protein n=1 Tax=Paenibacillus vietnamensis TaxID=2590547 RepID=UPI001CD18C7A|nr:hypothetical protein [Paenibacillus vietnamensis]MCA0756448.1 hypothetical protein [Paenibacillus vietnamensis]